MLYADRALPIHSYGTVVFLGLSRGIWAIAPLAKDLKDAGNRIISLLGAKVESDLLWEEAIRLVSDEVIVTALDGSRGTPSHVILPLLDHLNQGNTNLVVAVGPVDETERLERVVKAQGCAFVALLAES